MNDFERHVIRSAIAWKEVRELVAVREEILAAALRSLGDISNRRVLVKCGEWISCDSGHPICKAVDDIHEDQPNWADCLGTWQQPAPKMGGLPAACGRCGAEWVRGNSLHVLGRGWV